DRAAYADHAVDRRQRVLEAAQRLRERRARLRAGQAQLEAFARARTFIAEPVAHLEKHSTGRGSSEREAGEVLAEAPQCQIFARGLGGRSKEREHAVAARAGPFGVARRGVRCRARVGGEEKRIGFVDHDERLARRDMALELRDQALHAEPEEMLWRLRRNLADG